ncbi:RNA polymerase II [Ureibacillus acetophenoni]|uniref:RNA polymerase II n=1 Tax=Ureibacillus acetophenoni TaxID=614649 RepID=A0A285U067_9BACL|nr:RNA polymerase II [Ureibacillus acetophenoni]SOC35305.1 hypothetical protein SAMN05877842_101359 [Ureibacillus acetophenoni]
MKYAVSFFIVLLLVVSGLLFIQYQVYSDNLEAGQGEFTYTQEIEIDYRNNSLDIRQHFRNLPNQNIDIKWPPLAINPDCFLESEQTCERLSEDKTRFEIGDSRSQSLSYVIPLDGGLQSKHLLKDLFVTLGNAKVSYSTIHITTDSQIEGQWVTGLPLIGQQSLSLVNYSMFSGQGEVNEVYYIADDIKLQHSTDLISIYAKTPLDEQFHESINSIQFLNEHHVAIVQGESHSGQQGERIVFVNDLTLDGLNQSVLLSQIDSLYDFGDNPRWMKEVIAAFLTGSVSLENKSSQIVNALLNHMSDKQLESWIQKLEQLKGTKITSTVLDKELSEVLQKNTEFFELNETVEDVFTLLFSDNRKVILDQNVIEDVNLIYQNGLLYYSSDEILAALGYEVSDGPNGYYVNSELRQFRFPENHKFYVFNQRRYDTISNPFTTIMDKRYIEESWLQRLFLVEIEKTNSEITISPITTLQ